MRRNQLRIYRQRIKSQGVARTLRDVVNPVKVVRHLGRLMERDRMHSNPYMPSFSRDAEIRFVASLLGRDESAVGRAFAELDEDVRFVDDLKRRYAVVRAGSELHIGRFHILYALARLTRPNVIVETGVHDGLSAAVILRSLNRNGEGTLVSIDLPSTDLPVDAPRPGWLVPDGLRDRWEIHLGDARDLLPGLAALRAPIGLFFHDSDHSQEHQEFELRTVIRHMAANGVIISDQDYPFDPLMGALSAEWQVRHRRVRTVAGEPGSYMGGLALSGTSSAAGEPPA